MQMNASLAPTNNNKAVDHKVSTTTIKQQQKFQCKGEEFYNVFSTVEVIIISSYFLKVGTLDSSVIILLVPNI